MSDALHNLVAVSQIEFLHKTSKLLSIFVVAWMHRLLLLLFTYKRNNLTKIAGNLEMSGFIGITVGNNDLSTLSCYTFTYTYQRLDNFTFLGEKMYIHTKLVHNVATKKTSAAENSRNVSIGSRTGFSMDELDKINDRQHCQRRDIPATATVFDSGLTSLFAKRQVMHGALTIHTQKNWVSCLSAERRACCNLLPFG